ncbi:MAG TPA: Uma2 family endonuclease [Thermoanaerobaculia bacterium]
MSRASSVKFTYQDYLQLPEDRRYEIIGGELFLTPAPGTRHQRISARLQFLLTRRVRETGEGEIFNAPCDLLLSETDVVQPDLLFVARGRERIVEERYVSAAPDLVVEILSESTAKRDRGIKAKLYERTGVKEFWIVDPWEKTVEIFRRDGPAFVLHARFGASETLRTPTFPGLEIPLSEVFQAADDVTTPA